MSDQHSGCGCGCGETKETVQVTTSSASSSSSSSSSTGCNCPPDCDCGCQEGKPCTCGEGHSGPQATASKTSGPEGDVKAHYTVSGMTCEHCVKAVTEEVSEIPGVTGVTVDLASGSLDITSNEPIDLDRIVEAVDEAGDYTVA